MLRGRSGRAVGGGGGGKQGGGAGFTADTATAAAQSPRHPSSSSSSSSPSAASVFPSPRPFMAAMALPQQAGGGGFVDGAEGPASAVSPTSILETKQFCCSALPPFLSSERSVRRGAHVLATAAPTEPAGIGLADVLREHGRDAKAGGGGGGKVLFGSQLRVQVPSGSGGRAVELVSSPIEFGVKNRDAVLSPARKFLPEVLSSPPARVIAAGGGVSPVEMAMSEDYTCVISRGPNPRTRHIFDDCIVESCGDVLVEKVDKKAVAVGDDGTAVAAASSGFMTSCHACNKQLGQGTDIFIYRGDKAFCSSECRYQEMLFDEAVDNLR